MSTTNVDKIKCTDRSGRATWRKDNFRKQTSKTFHRHTHTRFSPGKAFPPRSLDTRNKRSSTRHSLMWMSNEFKNIFVPDPKKKPESFPSEQAGFSTSRQNNNKKAAQKSILRRLSKSCNKKEGKSSCEHMRPLSRWFFTFVVSEFAIKHPLGRGRDEGMLWHKPDGAWQNWAKVKKILQHCTSKGRGCYPFCSTVQVGNFK